MTMITGTADNDSIYGTPGSDLINGLAGHDYLFGDAAPDKIYGGIGDDYLDGGRSADALFGGEGNDNIRADGSDTLIDGGAGVDRLNLNRQGFSTGVTFSIIDPAKLQMVGPATLLNIESLIFGGGSGNDTVTGGALSDQLQGGAGQDVLNGGGGNDDLNGGSGSDTLEGGSGDDSVDGGRGADALFGGTGDDIFFSLSHANEERDTLIDGGEGTDFAYIDWSTRTTGAVFSLANPATAQSFDGTTILNVERVFFIGGVGQDRIEGGERDDQLFSGVGNDMLDGGAGNDYIDGGAGSDVLLGGTGDDSLSSNAGDALIDGGAGSDLAFIDFSRTTASVVLTLADTMAEQVFDGTTLINVEQIAFYGGTSADTVTGGGLSDSLYGNGGADVLKGEGGNDFLFGGAGKDYLTGGQGHDLFGFQSLDSRMGGGARDVITDFEVGVDKIDVSALGISSFSQLTFRAIGSGVIVYGDLDGNGLDYADFGLQLAVVNSLSAADFIFA